MPQRIENRSALTTTEAHTFSGLSQVYIQWLLRHGHLEGLKIGRDWLVYQDSLDQFLAQPRKPGPKPRHKSVASAVSER